jgi:hypothetical protein
VTGEFSRENKNHKAHREKMHQNHQRTSSVKQMIQLLEQSTPTTPTTSTTTTTTSTPTPTATNTTTTAVDATKPRRKIEQSSSTTDQIYTPKPLKKRLAEYTEKANLATSPSIPTAASRTTSMISTKSTKIPSKNKIINNNSPVTLNNSSHSDKSHKNDKPTSNNNINIKQKQQNKEQNNSISKQQQQNKEQNSSIKQQNKELKKPAYVTTKKEPYEPISLKKMLAERQAREEEQKDREDYVFVSSSVKNSSSPTKSTLPPATSPDSSETVSDQQKSSDIDKLKNVLNNKSTASEPENQPPAATITTASNPSKAEKRKSARLRSNARPNFVNVKFGQELSEIPPFVILGFEYLRQNALHVEGLFRLPGSHTEMEMLKEKLNNGQSINFIECENFHTVPSLIKLYFRELPIPLCTFECYEMFVLADSIPVPDARLDCLKRVLAFIPDTNFQVLSILCLFLHEVSQHSEYNKMSCSNLAIVFAPNLLRKEEETKALSKNAKNALALMAELQSSQNVIASFIEHAQFLFVSEAKSYSEYLQHERSGDSVSTERLLDEIEGDNLNDIVAHVARISTRLSIRL